jgi:hypothetical protein
MFLIHSKHSKNSTLAMLFRLRMPEVSTMQVEQHGPRGCRSRASTKENQRWILTSESKSTPNPSANCFSQVKQISRLQKCLKAPCPNSLVPQITACIFCSGRRHNKVPRNGCPFVVSSCRYWCQRANAWFGFWRVQHPYGSISARTKYQGGPILHSKGRACVPNPKSPASGGFILCFEPISD